uniref:Peptidase S1 domain-containing protein n=1 Tax=Astyanax mexicanus TaxID=7994 RepID=A0A3B1ILV2_ASTMX
MEPTASLSILALLMLGLTQAVPLMEPQHVDITTRILSTNNGSRELLLEGDIVLPRTRNALVCANNNCFWKKSSTGLVSCFTLSSSAVIAGAMATFHSKTCIRFSAFSDLPLVLLSIGQNRWEAGGLPQHEGCVYHGIVQHESDRGPLPCLNWPGTSTLQCSTNLQQVETPIQFSTHRTGYYSGRDLLIYGKAAFPINGLNTITPIPDHQSQIGDSRFWTWPIIDIQRINTLYNC